MNIEELKKRSQARRKRKRDSTEWISAIKRYKSSAESHISAQRILRNVGLNPCGNELLAFDSYGALVIIPGKRSNDNKAVVFRECDGTVSYYANGTIKPYPVDDKHLWPWKTLEETTFPQVPLDVLSVIARYLRLKDLCRLMQVSRWFRATICRLPLWSSRQGGRITPYRKFCLKYLARLEPCNTSAKAMKMLEHSYNYTLTPPHHTKHIMSLVFSMTVNTVVAVPLKSIRVSPINDTSFLERIRMHGVAPENLTYFTLAITKRIFYNAYGRVEYKAFVIGTMAKSARFHIWSLRKSGNGLYFEGNWADFITRSTVLKAMRSYFGFIAARNTPLDFSTSEDGFLGFNIY